MDDVSEGWGYAQINVNVVMLFSITVVLGKGDKRQDPRLLYVERVT